MAPPRKDPETVQDRRPARALAVIDAPDHPLTVPPLPMPVLAETADVWERFWNSDVARAVDQATDLPGLNRWIVAYDEWLRAVRALRRKRVVRGSTGQPVISPVAGYLAQREAELARADTAYGLSPRARASLGLIFGEAKLTAARLNEITRERSHAAREEADATILAEWEPA